MATYVLLFIIQHHLIFAIQNQFLQLGALTGTLIFLPHGLRVWAVLTGGVYILPGLFLGHFTTTFYYSEYIPVQESLIRVCLSMMAIYIPYYLLKIKDITLQNILLIALISSMLNSTFQTLYLQYSLINLNIYVLFTYLVGDIVGSLLFFYIVKYINYLIRIYQNS